MSEESKAQSTVLATIHEEVPDASEPPLSEEKLVKHVIASQEKVDRFRFLKLKVHGLMRKVRQDMRQIKSIVNKEKRRKDSCLSDNTSSEDCADLDALEEKLCEEE